jgi:hypothetical protein
MEERMKRVMKFSLLFDDDDDDDDICFYACVVCFYFVRYVRVKFYADFSSLQRDKKYAYKTCQKPLPFSSSSLLFAYTTQRERERERERERDGRVRESCSDCTRDAASERE